MEDERLDEQEKQMVLSKAQEIMDERQMAGIQDYPTPEEKPGFFQTFDKIFKRSDTTKSTNYSEEELRAVRRLEQTSIYAGVMDMPLVAVYLKTLKENISASSLSKKGFSVQALITSKKEFTSGVKSSGGQSGWFKKNVKQQE